MNTKQDIGTKIMTRRKELKLSQEELADMVGVARQAVSAWERNFFVPKGKSLMVLSRALKAPLSFFVEEETAKAPSEGPSSLIQETLPTDAPLAFELAPFAHLYDYTQTRAHTARRGSRAEAIRILKLTINELEKADTLASEEML